jgi:hypothetical protein
MNPSSPPTPSMRAPAGMPPSGNGKYVVLFVVLIVGIVALVAFKTCGGQPPPPPPKPLSLFDAAPLSHEDDNVPLPPPPEEPLPDAGRGRMVVIDPCGARTCTGTTTPDLETQIAYRAKQAHRCYDQALAQDGDLQGHVTLHVKIGSNGTVCAANVIANDMGVDTVASCVSRVFASSRSFPAPKGNCAEVNVPISFVKGGK